MLSVDWLGWTVASLSALLIGISKTGIPGIGTASVPLMAEVLPAKASVGVVLPLIIFADIFAATYYRRSVQWVHLLRLIPPAFIGIVIGFFALKTVSNEQLKPIIGVIILVMLGLNFWWTRRKRSGEGVPTQWWFAAGLGLLAGIVTMMANAAGPIMIIYLSAMRLPKTEFVGTGAWYYFIMNWVKVPFSASLGLITGESLKFDFVLFPLIAAGAIAGIFILKRIPQKAFIAVVQIFAAAAALHLALSPWI